MPETPSWGWGWKRNVASQTSRCKCCKMFFMSWSQTDTMYSNQNMQTVTGIRPASWALPSRRTTHCCQALRKWDSLQQWTKLKKIICEIVLFEAHMSLGQNQVEFVRLTMLHDQWLLLNWPRPCCFPLQAERTRYSHMLASRRTGSCATWPCGDVSNPNMDFPVACDGVNRQGVGIGSSWSSDVVLIRKSVAQNPQDIPRPPSSLI